MRLHTLDQVMAGMPVPDVIRVMMYHSEFFGQHFSDALQELLQGPSDWNIGERELFAAFVSSKNQCAF